MLKGTNTIILNEASIIEAVQEYLAKRIVDTYAEQIIVTGVTHSGSGLDATFKVQLEERKPT